MKIVFEKSYAPLKYDTFEYNITDMKFTKSLLAINIVDVGWRTLEPSQYDTFTIYEDKDQADTLRVCLLVYKGKEIQ